MPVLLPDRLGDLLLAPGGSIVTNAPFRSSTPSNAGMAAISWLPSTTACWPRIRRFSAAHALTRWRHPLNVALGAGRAAFPSAAICLSPVGPEGEYLD